MTGWLQGLSISNNTLEWNFSRTATPTRDTGPSSDHTGNGIDLLKDEMSKLGLPVLYGHGRARALLFLYFFSILPVNITRIQSTNAQYSLLTYLFIKKSLTNLDFSGIQIKLTVQK